MTQTPKMIAARDQLEAAIRERFDKHDVDLHEPKDRLTVLAVVGLVANAAMAFKDSGEDTPERRCQGIAYLLESLVKMVEDAQ